MSMNNVITINKKTFAVEERNADDGKVINEIGKGENLLDAVHIADRYEKKKFIESWEPSELPERMSDENSSREEELLQLHKAIEQLNQVEKAIVMLYMEDRSYEEMEEILGMSQGNLRVKMNRIKEKLRQLTKNN